jgi:hypothetical protein
VYRLNAAPASFKPDNLSVGQQTSTMHLSIGHIVQGEPEGINRSIFHLVGGNDGIRQGGFHFQGFSRLEHVHRNSVLLTVARELSYETLIISCHRHKQTTRVFDTTRSQGSKQARLIPAFLS